jgi:hypothetical protein
MGATTAAPPPRWTARAWLPLTVSLAAHGLLVLAAALAPSEKDAVRHFPVGALVIDDGRFTFEDPPGPVPRGKPDTPPGPDRGAGEEQGAFVATVVEPVEPAAGGTEPVPEAPVIVPAAGGGPGGGGGTGGTGGGGATFLRAPAAARKVVYAIDRSMSMGLNGTLDAARAELLRSLESLPSEARFQVVLYNREAAPLAVGGRTDLLPATEAYRQAVALLLEGVRAEGATDHVAALRKALALQPDTVFLVTDADDMTAEQVRAVTQLNRGRASIHAVELRDGAAREDGPLALLARLNGGTHRVVGAKTPAAVTASPSPLPGRASPSPAARRGGR